MIPRTTEQRARLVGNLAREVCIVLLENEYDYLPEPLEQHTRTVLRGSDLTGSLENEIIAEARRIMATPVVAGHA